MVNKSGLILTQEFEVAGYEKYYSGIVDYISREDAVLNLKNKSDMLLEAEKIIKSYSGIIDYMGNSQKTISAFTNDLDSLTKEEKIKIKKVFDDAQDNGSNQTKSIVSFDNEWLDISGLRDKKSGYINDAKLKQVMRICMRTIIDEEKYHENSAWVGAIHYNTQHIHIHASIVEPKSTRKIIEKGKYKGQARGMISQTTINKAKSRMVNSILSMTKENELINKLTRDIIVENLKNNSLISDNDLSVLFMSIHSALPKDNKRWFYNGKQMDKSIPLLDDFNKKYILKYCNEEYLELKKIALAQSEKYKEAYGESYQGYKTQQDFLINKEKDLLYRMGNTLLRKLRAFDKAYIINDVAELPHGELNDVAELPHRELNDVAELPHRELNDVAELPSLEDEQIQETENGIEYLVKSAALNNQYAQYKLGADLVYGNLGVKRDVKTGTTYLEKSKENGNKLAESQIKNIRKNKYSRNKNIRCLNIVINDLKKTLKKNMQDYVNEQQYHQLLIDEREKRTEITY